MHFDNYKEFLLYCLNSMVAEGKVDEILELVKSQPKGKAFNFEMNTQEGIVLLLFKFLLLKLVKSSAVCMFL